MLGELKLKLKPVAHEADDAVDVPHTCRSQEHVGVNVFLDDEAGAQLKVVAKANDRVQQT